MLEYIPRSRFTGALAGLRRASATTDISCSSSQSATGSRPLIGRWWQSNLYNQEELLEAFRRAGFSDVAFAAFPPAARHLAVWGLYIEAGK
jgi:hypothetical protein